MILKGSQRGGGNQLAAHLLRTDENEHVEVHEVRGFVADDVRGAMQEAYATSKGTRARQYIFSLSLNPPERESVPIPVFEDAIERAEQRLGLDGQPRVVVFHEKEGRRHAHCVWSRIDTEEMKAVPLPHTKLKLRDLSKELYLENGWLMPRGFIDSCERDPASFTHAEWQQAKRTETDPRALKATFAECWASSDSGKAFARALEERGYTLAQGDRRSVVALDFHGEVHAVARYAGIRTKEVRAKLGDGEGLPSVAEAKAQIAARMTPVVQRYIRESEEAFTSRAAPLQAHKEAMAREHREERRRLDDAQEVRRLAETTAKALANKLPVCVFGDPLQAVFEFKGQKPVDWDTDVYPAFAKLGELSTPHRWKKLGNSDLASWLGGVRTVLEGTGPLDLRDLPACVTWEPLPSDPKFRQAKVIGTCKRVVGKSPIDELVIMGDAANINARAALAQKLASVGFSNIEPLGCPSLYSAARKIESSTGSARLEAVMDFICSCMTGADQKPFLDGVASHQSGRKQGGRQFGDLIGVGLAVAAGSGDDAVLKLIEGFQERGGTRLFRDEMFFAMRAALRMKCEGQAADLRDAIWQVQNRLRHSSRILRRRCIGSVLLVKGLEFDHSVIVHSSNMTRKDWYVALTRATKSVTILAAANQVSPAS